MKIALISDTHYGITEDTHTILESKLQELAKEDFDILIHAGDWISHKQDQLESMLMLLRRYVSTPILGVKGNHDFWNKGDPKTLTSIIQKHKRLFKKYDVTYLEDKVFKEKDISIWGFNGWYYSSTPPTNDKYYMPKLGNLTSLESAAAMHEHLALVAHKKLDKILKDSANCSGTKICVTHFPPYTVNPRYETLCANSSYLDIICDNFNYFFVGHSHQDEDWMRLNCRVVNSGGDYNLPKYKIITV